MQCMDVQVINQAVLTHITNKHLVIRGLTTIGNLAFNNDINVQSCYQINMPYTIDMALYNHADEEDVHEAGIFVLGNLLTDDDNQKLSMCQQIGDRLLLALEKFVANPDFYLKAVRCMGNLSLNDDCISYMTERKGVALTVAGMKTHVDHDEHLKVAVELISNFAACEDEELDEKCTEFIMNEGGLTAVLDVMRDNDTNTIMLLTCFEALYNLADDAAAAEKLVEENVLQSTFLSIQNFDYEKDLVAQAMKFLSVISYNEDAVAALPALSGVEIVCQAMKTRNNDLEFVTDCMLVLSNARPVKEN